MVKKLKGKVKPQMPEEYRITVENPLLEKKCFWDRVVIDELGKKIVGEISKREIIFLCGIGRLVINSAYSSFNLLVHSESSAGKDYITKNVLKVFPNSYVFSRTRISPTVLNYWKPFQSLGQDNWNGCILYLPDISDSILNSDAMKLMCSDGSHITITEKGQAVDVEIKGKPVIFSTTANSTPNEEILNRFSIVHLDESEEQTRKIINMHAERISEGLDCSYSKEVIKALSNLKRVRVIIPFAKNIAKIFPVDKISQRRNFERFLDYIKAVAAFYQYQREKDGENQIIAEWEDYDKERDIFTNIQCGVSSIPINKRQKEIVKVLSKESEELCAADIHKRLDNYIALKNLRLHIDSLVNLKILEVHHGTDAINREIIKYKLSEEYLNFKPIKLPLSEELKNNN